MLVTPQKMIKNEWITSPALNLEDNQIQQVGLDVRIDKVMSIHGTATLTRTEKKLPAYHEISLNPDNCWLLQPGAYAVECIEQCNIPKGYEGRLIHRSTFNRSACFITGSVYDPGYRGVIAGTMYVHNPLVVERFTRIGQFQMRTAEDGDLYDGDYQDQISHAKAAEKLDGKDNSPV